MTFELPTRLRLKHRITDWNSALLTIRSAFAGQNAADIGAVNTVTLNQLPERLFTVLRLRTQDGQSKSILDNLLNEAKVIATAVKLQNITIQLSPELKQKINNAITKNSAGKVIQMQDPNESVADAVERLMNDGAFAHKIENKNEIIASSVSPAPVTQLRHRTP